MDVTFISNKLDLHLTTSIRERVLFSKKHCAAPLSRTWWVIIVERRTSLETTSSTELASLPKIKCSKDNPNEKISYRRAESPLLLSRGLWGSLDKAWQMKRSGTAHQCFDLSCWISWSKTQPTEQTTVRNRVGHVTHRRVLLLLHLCPLMAGSWRSWPGKLGV